MAERPIKEPLPADLPENWQAEQIVAPTGEEAGLTHQHGYNYLMEMVNRAQRGVNSVNEAFDTVSGKRTCRFVVGTSEAGWTAADCDYLCDGADDQVEIQAAIDALPKEGDNAGGEIVLLSGSYHLTGTVAIGPKNITVRGNGYSTLLARETADGAGASKCIIELYDFCTLSDLAFGEFLLLSGGEYQVAVKGIGQIENVAFWTYSLDSVRGCVYVETDKTVSGDVKIARCRMGGNHKRTEHGMIHLKSGRDVLVLDNETVGRVLISSDPECAVKLTADRNCTYFTSTEICVDGLRSGSVISNNVLSYLTITYTPNLPGGDFYGRDILVYGNVFQDGFENRPAIALGANTHHIFVTGNLLLSAGKDKPDYAGVQDNGTNNIVRFNSNDLSGSGGTPTTVSQAVPSISVAEGGLVTASATQAAGNVPAGTRSATHQLSAQDDPDLVPENIREGVSIFGVRGTVQAGTGGVTSETVAVIATLTEAEYNALSTKDPATLYLIKE